MGSGLARINLAAPPHEHHEQDALPPADFPELAQLVGTRSAYVARCVRAGSQTITNDGEYDLLTAALACDPVDLDLVHAVLASRSTELQELDDESAAELLESFAVEDKAPRSVTVIEVDAVYFQCARALVRSELWNPQRHVDPKSLPTAGQILAALSGERVGGETYDREWPGRAAATMW